MLPRFCFRNCWRAVYHLFEKLGHNKKDKLSKSFLAPVYPCFELEEQFLFMCCFRQCEQLVNSSTVISQHDINTVPETNKNSIGAAIFSQRSSIVLRNQSNFDGSTLQRTISLLEIFSDLFNFKSQTFLGHPHVICQLWNSQVNLYLEVGQHLVTKVRLTLNSDNKDNNITYMIDEVG